MIKILSVGHFLPDRVVTNDQLSASLDTSDAWISTRTGIRQRHLVNKDTLNSDLATAALKHALTNTMLTAECLDGIIVATITPDLFMPSTAVKVQQNLNIHSGFAFDVQAACAGFIYALNIAYSMIKAKQAKTIAVIGSEIMSQIVNWQDRSTCVLFGDGAGAFIIGETGSEDSDHHIESGIISIDMQSDGSYIDILKVNGGISKGNLDAKLEMSGTEVYKFAISSMSSSLTKTLQKSQLTADQLDWVIPHQANNRIIVSLAEKMNISIDKFAITVDKHANTSSASIPLALSVYMQQSLIKKGQLLALAAVGAGMTWGSAIIRL